MQSILNITRNLNQNITDEHFRKAAEVLNNIKSLNLSWCTGITDKSIAYMFSGDKNSKLEFLDMCGNQNVTDELFKKASEVLNNIKHLNVSWCTSLTDNTIDLVACSNVTKRDDKYIKNIFKNVECFQVFF